MPRKVILDTDIGTDVDDCLALTVLLGSPEIELVGISCVYGDVALRARMVARLLQLAGREEIPIATGGAQPLTPGVDVFWEGHEGKGLLEEASGLKEPTAEPASEFIARLITEQPGEIHLLAIGPLTNLALAMQREPKLFDNLAGLTIMGGAIGGDRRFDLPYAEHNLKCDPLAAAAVIEHPGLKQLVPLDVTLRVSIQQEDVERMVASGSAFLRAVADQVSRYPRFQRTGSTYLHDPLAAGLVADPDLMPLMDLHIDLETGGRYSAGATLAKAPSPSDPVNARVALDVDASAARENLVRRMLAVGGVSAPA